MTDGVGRKYPRSFYAGESLSADEMRVTILGSGGPFRRRAQAAPSVLVELGDGRVMVFDCGSGSAANLNALQLPQEKLDSVFITHLHCDHWADLTHLYAAHALFGATGQPFRVFGPSGSEERYGTAAFARGFEQAMAWDIDTRRGRGVRLPGGLEVHEFDYATSAWILEEDGLRVKAFPALHVFDGPVSYRVEWGGLSFVFSGDTIPNQFFVENSQNADLIVYDTALPPSMTARAWQVPSWRMWRDIHTPAGAAGQIFALTNPELAVMYHLSFRTEDRGAVVDEVRASYDGAITIAEDLMVFNVSPDGVASRGIAIGNDRPDPIMVPAGIEDEDPHADVRLRFSDWLADSELVFDGGPRSQESAESKD